MSVDKSHLAGNACRTTKLDPPVSLVYSEEFETFSDARKREAQIKRWTSAKKEALVSGDMTKLKMLSKSERIKNPKYITPSPFPHKIFKGVSLGSDNAGN